MKAATTILAGAFLLAILNVPAMAQQVPGDKPAIPTMQMEKPKDASSELPTGLDGQSETNVGPVYRLDALEAEALAGMAAWATIPRQAHRSPERDVLPHPRRASQ